MKNFAVSRHAWMVTLGATLLCWCSATGIADDSLDAANTRGTAEQGKPFEIEVVDKENGWPVPLVTLKTTHQLAFVTDNAGLIAIDQPELMEREVFFAVDGRGYEAAADGFGNRGVRLTPTAGGKARIELSRTIVAKRLGRLTGAGIYAHSQRLGKESSWIESGVFGCDSVQQAVHRGKRFWLWGDTTLAHYPLGIFHASSATTSLNPLGSAVPPIRVEFDYFRSDEGRPRGVAKMPGSGPTWLSGYVSLPAESGESRLVATYNKIKPPLESYEQGLCVWNDEVESFERLKVVWEKSADAPEPPPIPTGHPVFWEDAEGKRWVLFGDPFPTLRVPAHFESWQEPEQWEPIEPQRTLKAAADGAIVQPHSGSIAWNESRGRWVTVFMQRFGKPSAFGELWYAEADSPTGPWGPAVKVLSHENYTFYNPRIHPQSDEVPSSVLLFEGTYTQLFAANPTPTPRYDYNQILYRLDLDDASLSPAHASPPEDSSSVGLDWIRISDAGDYFVRGDENERFVPWGVNYDHDSDGRLLDEYWDDEWGTVAEDLREIKALGANCVRIHLQLGKFLDAPNTPNPAALERLSDLVELAEEIGLYLDLTGLACYHKQNIPAWYDALDEQQRWAAQEVFWESIAQTCSNSPAIFCYDLMNEPILPGNEPATEWLGGELGGKFFVQRLALDRKRRTREEIAEAWVAKMTRAIRRHDQQHLITVGVIPWVFVFGGGKPLFYSPPVIEHLDFVSVHFYPEAGEIEKALEALKAYDVGKPLVIEEMFPLKCGVEELARFVKQSADHVDGWISFYWGRTPDELRSQAEGGFAAAITASWLETFRTLAGQIDSIVASTESAAHESRR